MTLKNKETELVHVTDWRKSIWVKSGIRGIWRRGRGEQEELQSGVGHRVMILYCNPGARKLLKEFKGCVCVCVWEREREREREMVLIHKTDMMKFCYSLLDTQEIFYCQDTHKVSSPGYHVNYGRKNLWMTTLGSYHFNICLYLFLAPSTPVPAEQQLLHLPAK